MVAAAVGAGELAIDEDRHARLDRAGPDRIGGDQPVDRRLDEGAFGSGEEDIVVAARDRRRRIGGPFGPRHRRR